MADGVGDVEADVVLVQADDIVQVAADVGGGAEQRGEVGVADGRQPLGQEVPLDAAGQAELALEPVGPAAELGQLLTCRVPLPAELVELGGDVGQRVGVVVDQAEARKGRGGRDHYPSHRAAGGRTEGTPVGPEGPRGRSVAAEAATPAGAGHLVGGSGGIISTSPGLTAAALPAPSSTAYLAGPLLGTLLSSYGRMVWTDTTRPVWSA